MNPVTGNENTLMLNALNPEAFSAMVACGHRAASIQSQTHSKFKINTECTSGVYDYGNHKCKGFMQFNITKTGTNLYLGTFNHSEKCTKSTGYNTETYEDLENNIDDFKENSQTIISAAITSAEAEHEKTKKGWEDEEKRGLAIALVPYYGYKIIEDLQRLKEQFNNYLS